MGGRARDRRRHRFARGGRARPRAHPVGRRRGESRPLALRAGAAVRDHAARLHDGARRGHAHAEAPPSRGERALRERDRPAVRLNVAPRALPLPVSVRRHRAAALRAATAYLGAVLHHLVAHSDRLAGLGAALARIGTDAADRGMQLRTAEHEVARRIAGLRAVEQGRDVLRRSVLAAPPKAVHQRLHAYVVAVRAVLDALAHLVRDVLGPEMVGHEKPPLCDARRLTRSRESKTADQPGRLLTSCRRPPVRYTAGTSASTSTPPFRTCFPRDPTRVDGARSASPRRAAGPRPWTTG